MTRKFLLALGVSVIAVSPAAAQDRQRSREIAPYIEVGQVLTADLQNGDVLTYSTVAAGVDASIQTQRVQVQLSYQYERRIAWDKKVNDDDIHSGLARAAVAVAPGFSVEGGAIATRIRSDQRGDAPGVLAGNVRNISQVYSAYAGPTLAKQAGPLNVAAAYRFGYTKAEAPGFTGVPAGEPVLDAYDSSTSHSATASVGVKSGTVLPVGLTASAGWERETTGQLDQRYEGKHVRGDVVVPVSPSFAVAGGVGYEKIDVSQRDPLFDAQGNPVVDSKGRYVTDPASPRRAAFRTDGLYWDAGVIWRPSRRTMVEARYGRRYDSDSFTGMISYQPNQRLAMQVTAYDQIQSFGRQMRDGLAMLPTSFTTTVDPFSDQFSGCVFGDNGSAGGCLNGALTSVNASYYRNRGVDGAISYTAGQTRMGVGIGYTNRRFIAPRNANFDVAGLTDSSVYGQFFITRELDPNSGVTGTFFANYFDSQVGNTGAVWGGGVTGAYYRRFGPINATASIGLYTSEADGVESDTAAQAMLGLRYGF